MNWIFFLLISVAYGATAWQQWQWAENDTPSPFFLLTDHLLHAAQEAITLSMGLIGILALFLGLMRILEKSGLLSNLAKLIYPLLKYLFPDIPANHPAFAAITMNLCANMMGMGNAATPFGLKAMQALEKLNPHPGIATNAMVLFLAINTACITIFPTKIIALRASAGSHDPAGIIATTLFATLCATCIAILSAKCLQRIVPAPPSPSAPSTQNIYEEIPHYPLWASGLALLCLILLIPLTLYWGKQLSAWVIPTFIVSTLTLGMFKKIDIYASFTEGAKEGFEIAVRIIPFLVAILVAIGMFRASGALTALTHFLGPFTTPLGLPAEALPMVLMRPLSGSGSFGILSDLLKDPTIGPDSYTGYLVSTLMGSTETTFYVLSVYFGAIQIRRIRHALAVGLIADLAALIGSIIIIKMMGIF